MARTMIHGRLAQISDRLERLEANVGRALAAVAQAVQHGTDTSAGVARSAEHVAAEIGGLRAGVCGELATVNQRMGRAVSAMNFIDSAILAATGQEAGEPTPKAFEYLRAVGLVEDVVTDRDFAYAENSAQLAERWNEGPTRNCYQTLMSVDPNLAGRFQAVYGPFLSDDFHERAARFREIQGLRRDLVRHCGPPPPPPRTAPDTSTRRGRRK